MEGPFSSYLGDALTPEATPLVTVRLTESHRPYLVATGDGIPAGTVISRSSLGVIPIPILTGLVAANGVAAAKLAATSPVWGAFSKYASGIVRPAAHDMITSVRTDATLDVLSAASLGPAALLISSSHGVHRWTDFAPLVPGKAAPGVFTDMRKTGAVQPLPGENKGRVVFKSRRGKVVPPLVAPVCPVGGNIHAVSPLTAALSRIDSLDVLSSLAARRKTDPTAFVQPNIVVAAYMDLATDANGGPAASWELVIEVRVLGDADIPAGTALMYEPTLSMEASARVNAVVKDSVAAWKSRAEKWVALATAQFARQDKAGGGSGSGGDDDAHTNLLLSLMMPSYNGPPPAFPQGPGASYRFPAAHVLVLTKDISFITANAVATGLKWMTAGLSALISSMRTEESWHPADFLGTALEILLSADAAARGMDPTLYAQKVQNVVLATRFAQEEFVKAKGGTPTGAKTGEGDTVVSPYASYVTPELLLPRNQGVGSLVTRFVRASLGLLGVQHVTLVGEDLNIRLMTGVGFSSEKEDAIPYILLPKNLPVPSAVIKAIVDAAMATMAV